MSVLLHMNKFIHCSWVCVVKDKQVSHMFLVCTLFILKFLPIALIFFLLTLNKFYTVFNMITFLKRFSHYSL